MEIQQEEPKIKLNKDLILLIKEIELLIIFIRF